jgi:NAD(P)-dependent dehydrogenase (short-subunit alcohol dehydrogenase family)
MRTVVVGASSGLGRCIGIGLAQRGAQVALLARRKDRLDDATAEAGPNAVALECDVTDEGAIGQAITAAAEALGGIDALIYAPAVGPLARIEATDAETWARVFGTNVIGASITTSAALPHLKASNGRAVYLSSIIASLTPPWPGLGAYAVSKAALDKLVDAWRAEHPDLGFTRIVVGDCGGGQGDAMSGFNEGWDMDLATELIPGWLTKGYLSGALFDVEDLINTVDALLRAGPTVTIPAITLAPRANGMSPEAFLEGANP